MCWVLGGGERELQAQGEAGRPGSTSWAGDVDMGVNDWAGHRGPTCTVDLACHRSTWDVGLGRTLLWRPLTWRRLPPAVSLASGLSRVKEGPGTARPYSRGPQPCPVFRTLESGRGWLVLKPCCRDPEWPQGAQTGPSP